MTRPARYLTAAIATMLIAGVIIALSFISATPDRFLAGALVSFVFAYCMEHLKNV